MDRSSKHWTCTGKENYFDQQFQSKPSVSKELNGSSLIEFLRMFVRTQWQVLSKQSFAIDHKLFRWNAYFSPALCQQFAICRKLCWLECHYRFYEILFFYELISCPLYIGRLRLLIFGQFRSISQRDSRIRTNFVPICQRMTIICTFEIVRTIWT